ncbi:hypothetical protein GGR55DRAFT_671575 [Xylaria sp. FL0064]|nr:hypothetical protein GGR55DRAFT_671575 [Xylaria sp. FL0064]
MSQSVLRLVLLATASIHRQRQALAAAICFGGIHDPTSCILLLIWTLVRCAWPLFRIRIREEHNPRRGHNATLPRNSS